MVCFSMKVLPRGGFEVVLADAFFTPKLPDTWCWKRNCRLLFWWWVSVPLMKTMLQPDAGSSGHNGPISPLPSMTEEPWLIVTGMLMWFHIFKNTAPHRQTTMKAIAKASRRCQQQYHRCYQPSTPRQDCAVTSRRAFFPLRRSNADIILEEQYKDRCIYSPTLILFTGGVNLSLCLLYTS